jgi:hypothetical protein
MQAPLNHIDLDSIPFTGLGGHLKSGHMRSLQNRPYGLA